MEEVVKLEEKSEVILKTFEEAAKITGIGRDTFRKMANEHRDFPKIKIGTRKFVIMEKLAEWFNEHRGEQLC